MSLIVSSTFLFYFEWREELCWSTEIVVAASSRIVILGHGGQGMHGEQLLVLVFIAAREKGGRWWWDTVFLVKINVEWGRKCCFGQKETLVIFVQMNQRRKPIRSISVLQWRWDVIQHYIGGCCREQLIGRWFQIGQIFFKPCLRDENCSFDQLSWQTRRTEMSPTFVGDRRVLLTVSVASWKILSPERKTTTIIIVREYLRSRLLKIRVFSTSDETRTQFSRLSANDRH